jgi:hypothetical protein
MGSFWLIVGLQVLGLIVASALHAQIGRWLA